VLSVAVAASAWAQAPQHAVQANPELTLNLDLAQSKLRWTLGSTLHTVHGTFALRIGKLQFDAASGESEFIAYATRGESGNDSRDNKMHREILESARYPDVSLELASRIRSDAV
jgi:hypothetical protein